MRLLEKLSVSNTSGRLNLKQRISDEISAIPLAMLPHVMENVLNRVHQCISLDGHLTCVIFLEVSLL